jgi:hypothetical protein
MVERIWMWLDRHGIMHRYEFFTAADHYAHEGMHMIKFTTYAVCQYCDMSPDAIDVDWETVGPLERFPIEERGFDG